MEELSCLNCETKLRKEDKYCPECGLKIDENLTVAVLFSNTVKNYFSVDARFFKSFIPLLVRPGFLARKFVDGKRLVYLHPAQFYLFISVVFFFFFSFITRKQQQEFESEIKDGIIQIEKEDSNYSELKDSLSVIKANEELKKFGLDTLKINDVKNKKSKTNFGFDNKKLDSLIAAKAPEEEKFRAMGMKDNAGSFMKIIYKQLLKIFERKGGGLLELFYDMIPMALFILLPIFALILKLLYFRKGKFAHHLVFSFYYFSYIFSLSSLLLIINFIYDIPDWIDFLIVLSTGIYLIIGMMKFYKQKFFISFIKSGLLSFVYTLLVLPISFVLMIGVTFMLY